MRRDDELDQFVGFEEEADPKRQITDEERKREAIRELNEIEQLRALLESEAVRDFLFRLMAKCHVFTSIFDTHYGKMAFMEGERNIGLWLGARVVLANPAAFRAMREKAETEASEARRRELERAAGLKRPTSATP